MPGAERAKRHNARLPRPVHMIEPTLIRVGEAFYDITHLAPTRHTVPVLVRGNIAKVPVRVSYTNHCYSRTPRAGEQVPAGHEIKDGAKQRMFCEQRHRLSSYLPQILIDLLQGETSLWQAAGGNFLQVELVDDVDGEPPTKIEYNVILRMERLKPEGDQKHIMIRVETAYPEDIEYDKPFRKKSYKVSRILAAKWEDRDHREPEPKTGKGKGKGKKK